MKGQKHKVEARQTGPQAGHNPVHIIKFGGTSVSTAKRIRRAVRLVKEIDTGPQRVIVVSALGGVTDQLLAHIEVVLRGGAFDLEAIRDRHLKVAKALAHPDELPALRTELDSIWHELNRLLQGVGLLRECTPRTRDAVMSTGERAAAPIVSAALRKAGEDSFPVDARTIVRTDNSYGEARVDFDATMQLTRTRLQDLPRNQVAVVTGFIGSAPDGSTTTLGRSGSDYTATILGLALRAERVVIWTDVDGVLSADPRDVPEAFPLSRLSYTEAAEMAYFGARVLHPRTMRPVQMLGIPLLIKNSLNPKAPGTLISKMSRSVDWRVKAISTIREVAVVMVEGSGMLGMPGIAARVFNSLAERKINVLMIAQASSEHSICVVVRESEAMLAEDSLREVFTVELRNGDVSRVLAVPRCAVVSAVGDRMRHRPGLAGRMFATLGRSRVNVLSIAQGAAETNISAVVRDDEVQRAVRALHEAFPLARLRAHICLMGPGRVGQRLLEIIDAQHEELIERVKLNLRLVGLANSRNMRWNADGLSLGQAAEQLQDARPANLDWLVEQLGASRLERLIVVDATASAQVAARYPDFLEMGLGVVTANKLANTREMPFYRRLQKAARRREVAYRYETTVGAGLPVVSTLKNLLRAGDRVHAIEGLLSGTLAYIFNGLERGEAFSSVLAAAHERGFTEPNPADDLSGEDVARKLLILARELGMDVARSDIEVEPLLPAGLSADHPNELFKMLRSFDGAWSTRVQKAARDGLRLRYLARISDGKLRVGVRAVNSDSPFAHVNGRDNVIAFRTDRYAETPLVVQGPGAGLSVTAAGLLADLIQAAELMP